MAVPGEFTATYDLGGVEVEFRYGQVFHGPGSLSGAVMIKTAVGPKFVGAIRRNTHPDSRWRRLQKQHNSPSPALVQARAKKYTTNTRTKEQIPR